MLYVCPVIGSGADGDPQRPLIADLGVTRWSAAVGTDDRGKPLHGWAVVWCEADDWSAVTADALCVRIDLVDKVAPRTRAALARHGIIPPPQGSGVDVAEWLLRRHYPHASLADAFPQVT